MKYEVFWRQFNVSQTYHGATYKPGLGNFFVFISSSEGARQAGHMKFNQVLLFFCVFT